MVAEAILEIFRTDISSYALDSCLSLLDSKDLLRVRRLDGLARRRFVASRAFRRRVLGPDVEILTDENGRPTVKGNSVFFSISHTGDVLVMALDAHPVGIDAEMMKPRNFAKLSSWFFGESIPECEAFYRHWTRFEAGLKLAGLPLFSKNVPTPKHLHSEAMGNFMLSLASNHGLRLPLSIRRM